MATPDAHGELGNVLCAWFCSMMEPAMKCIFHAVYGCVLFPCFVLLVFARETREGRNECGEGHQRRTKDRDLRAEKKEEAKRENARREVKIPTNTTRHQATWASNYKDPLFW